MTDEQYQKQTSKYNLKNQNDKQISKQRIQLNNKESTNYDSENMTNNKSMIYKNSSTAENQFSEPIPVNTMNSGSNMIDGSRKNYNLP